MVAGKCIGTLPAAGTHHMFRHQGQRTDTAPETVQRFECLYAAAADRRPSELGKQEVPAAQQTGFREYCLQQDIDERGHWFFNYRGSTGTVQRNGRSGHNLTAHMEAV